jgi:3-phytase
MDPPWSESRVWTGAQPVMILWLVITGCSAGVNSKDAGAQGGVQVGGGADAGEGRRSGLGGLSAGAVSLGAGGAGGRGESVAMSGGTTRAGETTIVGGSSPGGQTTGGQPTAGASHRGGDSVSSALAGTGGGFGAGTASTAGGQQSGGVVSTGGRGSSGGTTGNGGAGGGVSLTGSGGGGTLSQIPASPSPTVESESLPAGSVTDIADDCAIYANPTSPELSVVIADDKDDSNGGVVVFNMQGKLLQFRQDGKIGNIDLRADFPLGGKPTVLVGANNRTGDTLIFWQLDPVQQQLSAPIGQGTKTVSPNYGFCMYHSARSGKFYAFVSQETGTSTLEQYELGESAGKVTATKVRSFEVGSITEGCVADDDLGRLYVAQEDVALWRYDAEPTGGSTRSAVATVGEGGVVADLEGVALAKGPGTSGYIVLSIQSQSRFAVYDRESNAPLRTFTVDASGSSDATSESDGLDISTANLGPGFPKGALVVHDGSNTGGTTSNLKFIPLQ